MNYRHCVYMTVFFAALLLVFGCGGGGGGGGVLNPLGGGAFDGETADLSGRVTLNNVPLANVNVYLYNSESALSAGLTGLASTFASLRMSLQATQQGGVYTTTTDDEGYYRFQGIPAGEYSLIAVKDATHQYAKTGMTLRGAVTNVDAQITPTGSIQGTISVSGRTDVGGAMAYLEGTSYVALTDQAGRFTITNVPTGATFQLRVTFGSHALAAPMAVMAPPGSAFNAETLILVEQQLPPSYGSVIGSATRAAFAPGDLNHAGTIVLLKDTGGFPAGITISSADGDYRISAVKPGTYRLQFAADGYTVSPESVEVVVTANEIATAKLVSLTPKTTGTTHMVYTGKVIKTEFPAGHNDHSGIALLMTNDAGSFMAVTDHAGEFRFSLPGGTYRLQALETFRLTGAESGVVNGSASVTLPAIPGVFQAQSTVSGATLITTSFSGTVTKATFRPGEITDAGINVMLSGNAGSFVATTGEDGKFSFPSVPEGTYRFSALAPFTLLDSDRVIGGSAMLDLPTGSEPEYQAQIFALVRDSVTGNATKKSFPPGQNNHSGVCLYLEGETGGFQTETDSDGNFAFNNVPRGTYHLRALTPFRIVAVSGSPVGDGLAPVILPLQGQLQLQVEFLAVTTVKYDGKVLLSGETDHSGVELLLSNSAGSYLATTDAHGFYEFTQVPVGTYTFRVLAPYKLVDDGVTVINGSATMYLPNFVVNFFEVEPITSVTAVGGFKGKVEKQQFRGSGRDHSGIEIWVTSSSLDYQRRFLTDTEGNFEVTGIPLGVYDVSIGNQYYEQHDPLITTLEAKDPINEIESVIKVYLISFGSFEYGEIRGSITGDVTRAIPLELLATDGGFQMNVSSKDDKSFVFKMVPPGEYIVRCRPESGWQGESDPIELSSGEELFGVTFAVSADALPPPPPEIESFGLDIEDGIISISGVNFGDGTEPSGVFAGALQLPVEDGEWSDTTIEVDISILPPGVYRLRVKDSNGAVAVASTAFAILEEPKGIKTKATTNSIKVTWDKVIYATEYNAQLFMGGVFIQEANTYGEECLFDDFAVVPNAEYKIELQPFFNDFGGPSVEWKFKTRPITDGQVYSMALDEKYDEATLEAFNGKALVKAKRLSMGKIEYLVYDFLGAKVGALSEDSMYGNFLMTLGWEHVYFADKDHVYKRSVADLSNDVNSAQVLYEPPAGRILSLKCLHDGGYPDDGAIAVLMATSDPASAWIALHRANDLALVMSVMIDDPGLQSCINHGWDVDMTFSRNRSCVLLSWLDTFSSPSTRQFILVKWPDGEVIWQFSEEAPSDIAVVAPYGENDFWVVNKTFSMVSDYSAANSMILRKVGDGTPLWILSGLFAPKTANPGFKNRIWGVMAKRDGNIPPNISYDISVMDDNFVEKWSIGLSEEGFQWDDAAVLQASMVDPVTGLMFFLGGSDDDGPSTLYWVDTDVDKPVPVGD